MVVKSRTKVQLMAHESVLVLTCIINRNMIDRGYEI